MIDLLGRAERDATLERAPRVTSAHVLNALSQEIRGAAGEILSAFGVLMAGAITAYFHEDYGRAGSITTLVFGLGMIVILFAPDTTKKKLTD